MKLGIRVTNIWCHPEFGGTQERTKTYPMNEAEKASEMYIAWAKGDNFYAHTTISFFRLLENKKEKN